MTSALNTSENCRNLDDTMMMAFENSDFDDALLKNIILEDQYNEENNNNDDDDVNSDADLLKFRMRTILEYKKMRQIKQNVISKNFKYFITK